MIWRTPDKIRAKFAQLRGTCDPLGLDVLDELERACLRDNALLMMHDRVGVLQERLANREPTGDVFGQADVVRLDQWSRKVDAV